jgi:hypothetical protein
MITCYHFFFFLKTSHTDMVGQTSVAELEPVEMKNFAGAIADIFGLAPAPGL